ncbi:glycosyltransferase family 2 protein [Rufibacter sp. LB8]|uniref:glycosyltransferase family 2 protein n=1 Tax=Rufibacter sp. LB8 TaxID=2777781 RepID=UPI00178C4999|nr:glycosyltransferase [Rufibacter sp. LB8]
MVSEISILIPVFNQPVLALVQRLHQQATALPISFEIRVYDDGSNSETKIQNQAVAALAQVVYQELPQNLGRTQIRLKLARDAKFPNLLFLDNDVLPVQDSFLQTYVQEDSSGIMVGGVTYADTCLPGTELRWKYGREREQANAEQRQKAPYQRVFFSNLLAPKDLFLKYFSGNALQGYGHEDTLFAFELQQANIQVKHLDNPVWHLGLEAAPVFLDKTKQALQNLVLLQQKLGLGQETRLFQLYFKLKRFRVLGILNLNSSWLLPLLEKQLQGKKPSLYAFDVYRLLWLSQNLK